MPEEYSNRLTLSRRPAELPDEERVIGDDPGLSDDSFGKSFSV